MDMKQKKILIIDDEAVFRQALCDALIEGGYTCVAVESPSDGIKSLKSEDFDLVLLDIMMDPLDGWDTLDLIKNLPQGQDIPVIMSSAKKVFAEEIIRFGDQISGFIKKPFQDADLREDIDSFFAWYDSLLSDAAIAESKGVPKSACDQWTLLMRQIRSFRKLKEVANPRCIPEDSESEEVCITRKFAEIQQIIDEKIRMRDTIIYQYPSLPLRE